MNLPEILLVLDYACLHISTKVSTESFRLTFAFYVWS